MLQNIKEDLTIKIPFILNLLNLKDNDIEEIEQVIVNENEINFYVKLKPQAFCCKSCGSTKIEKKDWRTRKVHSQIFNERKTTIYVKFCRYKCLEEECKKVFQEPNNLLLKQQRLSIPMIKKVAKELMDANATYAKIAERLHLSPTTVINTFDRFIYCPTKKLPQVLCIDEIYTGHNFLKPYACVLLDHTNFKIVDILQGRNKVTLRNYFLSKTQDERDKVRFVNIDMWEPYLAVVKSVFPKAIPVVDSFHVMQNLGRALHDTRCRIQRKYDQGTIEYYLLKNTKDSLYKPYPLDDKKTWNSALKSWESEESLVEKTVNLHPDLFEAHNFYLRYKRFNSKTTALEAEEKFDAIVFNPGKIAEVEEFSSVIQMLQTWREYILNSFVKIDNRRLSNGPIEGANSQLKKIKKTANGYTNFKRFRNRGMLIINKEYVIKHRSLKETRNVGKKRGKYMKK